MKMLCKPYMIKIRCTFSKWLNG